MALVRGYPGQTIASNVFLDKQSDIVVSTETVENDELDHDDKDNYLIVSPYTEKEHLLDLRTLDKENALLAKALVKFRSLRPDYATAPYTETFNWDQVMEELTRLVREEGHVWKETSFYIVAFRSQIPPTTVYAELGVLDKAAHAEATASGGFLKYWFGTPDQEGRNLATCVWRSQQDARQGGVGPAHRKAAGAARHLYSEWRIDRHRLIIRDDLVSWQIVDWAD
ncbi:hypothetical protein PFICI_15377 [Pestalotiopsis fici W106-1]|uniref:Uncharacterized protein n=1 Tax=Pestalotiopsis fici (strain W106-1 / CGMCC3.15140) TaxID=1229662 RepID=W3WGD5_PESFW|nr:uncharacterized protein PFICI_15377 [Pestalotiopsis fici W106-1]ETS72985.1 hypothetical protein PFICI_15377 [Pestalotiopsis fici W106-1]